MVALARAALGLAASFTVVRAQSSRSPADAWQFTWAITPTAEGQPARNGLQVMDVAIRRGVARITVRDGPLRRMTGEQGMMLLRASDSALMVINPTRREVLVGSLSDLGAMLGGPASNAPLEVTGIVSSTRASGTGAPILRFATRRAELTQRYTLRVTAPGVLRQLQTEQVVTFDVSRDLLRLDPGFGIFAEQFGRGIGLPEAVRTRLRAAERGVPAGFPVRSTTVGVTIAGADTLRITTRSELTQLRRESVDTMSFVAPAGFRVTEIRRLLQRQVP